MRVEVVEMSPVRFGVIGAGGIGGRHLEVLEQRSDVEVLIGCDVSESVRGSLIEKGYAATEKWEEVVENPDVDAVVVALPHHLYPLVVSEALRCGKHVLQEKPLAHNLAGAMITLEAGKDSVGSILMVCGQSKYQPGFQRAKETVESGVLGKLFMIRGAITYRWAAAFDEQWSWRGTKALSGGTAIIDSGWHILDLMNWFAGVPESVYATTGEGNALPGEYDVDDRAIVTMEYAGGAVGVATISFICLPAERKIVVHGTEGSLEVTDTELRLHLGAQQNAEITTFPAVDNSLSPQMARFIELIRGAADPPAGALAAVDVQRVIDAAYRSAASGQRVKLAAVL
jgi:UDP-N-acetyl-2-amino-2-deoxyglucuronate dehydrogenase